MTTSSRRSDEWRSLLRTLALGGLLLGLLGAAHADETLTFKERYDRAVTTFKSGQFDKAVEQFQALYQEKPIAILLFNLAQAHRKANHYKEALDLYERYLREDPKSDLRAETEGYMNDMKAAMAAAEEAERKAAEEKAKRELDLAIAKAAAEEPPPMGFDRSGQRLKSATRPIRVLKWVAAGAGILAIGAGASLLALNGRPTCNRAPGQELCPQQLDTLGAGIGGLAAGGLLLGGAAALFAIDYKQHKEIASIGPIRDPLLGFSYLRTREGDQSALLTLSGRF